MGFFSFLSAKKGPGDTASLNAGLDIKSQPYDTTAIALPPIRGTLPVTGNGPNTLSDLKRAARKRSQAQLSTKTAIEPSAPSSMVPRMRSKSVGRPSTAPSIPAGLPHQRPKSANRNSSRPPFLVQKTTQGPPYLLGMTGPEYDDPDDASAVNVPPPVPPIAAHFMKRDSTTAPSSPRTAYSIKKGPGSITGSVMSGRSAGTGTIGTAGGGGGAVGYVDILDAQGSLRPSNFKTRLRAAGARDYGEDVAERNMAVNTVDLNSPAVLAFYAITGGEPLAYKSDGSAVDVHGNNYAAGNIPTDLATTIQGKDRDELSALANQRIRTPRFPERTTSLRPQPLISGIPMGAGDLAAPGDDKSKDDDSGLRRPLSVHAGRAVSSPSQPKPRPLSLHPAVLSYSNEAAVVPDIPTRRPATGPDQCDIPSNISSRSRSRDSNLTASKKKQERRGDGRPRSRSTKSTRSATSQRPSKPRHDAEAGENEPSGRLRSASSASRKSRKQKHEDFSQFDFGAPSTEEAVPPIPSSRFSTRSGSSVGPQVDSRPQSQRSPKASNVAQIRTEEPPLPPHPRKRSVGATSLRGRPQLDNIDEVTPGRRSSWRNESVSSMAPSTTATASSNMSGKHSRHTADTSLDLSYSMPAAQKQLSLNGIAKKSHTRGKSSGTTVSSLRGPSRHQTQRSQARSPFTLPVDEDGYLSSTTDGSDIESYVEKRRRRRNDDEDLLFKEDGYGQTGGGLPGLFNGDAAPINPTWASSFSTTAKNKKHTISRARPPTSAPRLNESTASRRAPHPSLRAWEYDDDDDTSSLTISESDAGMRSRSGSGATAELGSILSGDGHYDPEEEALEEKLDARLAMRLRKEMKRRERTSTRQQTLQARVTQESYEQGHIADTEA